MVQLALVWLVPVSLLTLVQAQIGHPGHSHQNNKLDYPRIDLDLDSDYFEEEPHWETVHHTMIITPATQTSQTTVYLPSSTHSPGTVTETQTVYATSYLERVSLSTVTWITTQSAVTVTHRIEAAHVPKHVFDSGAINKDRNVNMQPFSLPSPVSSPPMGHPYTTVAKGPAVVTKTIVDAPPTPVTRVVARKGKAPRKDKARAKAPKKDATDGGSPSCECSDCTSPDDSSETIPEPGPTPDGDTSPCNSPSSTVVDSDPCETPSPTPNCSDDDTTYYVVQDDACYADTNLDSTTSSDYEHQYGDDTMQFMLDTKDHVRHRYGKSKERAKKVLSHFRPSHIHDRVDQVVHDERPWVSDEHALLHSHVVKESCDSPPVRASKLRTQQKLVRPQSEFGPVRKKSSCNLCGASAKDSCGCDPAPAKAVKIVKAPASCGCDQPVPIKDTSTCEACGQPIFCADYQYEHQYGDDTMQFLLDTKDHARSRWQSFKDRTKKALSHLSPSHIHDRVSQAIHDRRPDVSCEHADSHARNGRKSPRRG